MGPDVRRFAESEVTRIRQKRRDSLLNGALFGGLVGGAVGLMGENACGNDFGCSSAKGASLALGLGLGIGGGVGVDALIVRERTIYDRRPTRGASLGVAPLVGRGTQGAVVSLRF